MLSESYRALPTHPGVYLFKDENGKTLYIGKAKNLKKRVASYFTKSDLDQKTAQLVGKIASVDHIVVGSEIEAFLLEANLIKKYHPFYNIQFRDDKYYPYIEIGKGDSPCVVLTRKIKKSRGVKLRHPGGALGRTPAVDYFGPYTSAENVKTVLKILRRIFPFQSVRNHPKRQCLYHHLSLCPCVPIFPEKLPEYKRNIQKIERFLEGKKDAVIKLLQGEQKQYSKNEEFEKAAVAQKKIDKINYITSGNYSPFAYEERPDLYYERIKNEAASLGRILNEQGLNIPSLRRIECYDISNFGGREATGSMVVFVNGEASKKDYRKFRIRTKTTPDDFAMLSEIMGRRLKHLEDWGKPDLLIIDGGKGQVSSVLEVLVRKNKHFPVIGLAKREEIIVLPARNPLGKLEFVEVKLPKSTPGINLLRRIRDEAHRFAVTYHRFLRKRIALA